MTGGINTQAIEQLSRRFDLVEEKLEVMNGDRIKSVGRSAVRKNDLAAITELSELRHSRKASVDPPSKEDFDLLVDEVTAIRQAIEVIANAVRVD